MSWSQYPAFVHRFTKRGYFGIGAVRPEAASMANVRQLKTGSAVSSRAGRLRTSLRSLLTANGGVVSVEFMLWMPVVFLVILFTADVSLIYLKQADMWNVARDTARRMSVSSTYNPTQAQIQANLFGSLQTATAVPTGATQSGVDKVVTIQIQLCKASLFGVVGCFQPSFNLTARVTMASEY